MLLKMAPNLGLRGHRNIRYVAMILLLGTLHEVKWIHNRKAPNGIFVQYQLHFSEITNEFKLHADYQEYGLQFT